MAPGAKLMAVPASALTPVPANIDDDHAVASLPAPVSDGLSFSQ
jgi:hypothetical protein